MISRSLLVIFMFLVLANPARGQVTSSFDAGDEGWLVRDVDCYDGFDIEYETHPVAWHAEGGNPGGYISHLDVTNYCSFISAPAVFVGDKSGYIGGSLEFSLNSTATSWPYTDVVVLIGAGLVLCHELPEYPAHPPAWTSFSVQLTAAAFTYDDENGTEVSTVDFQAVMTDLQVLLFPAEYGSSANETVGLDSVTMAAASSPVQHVAFRPDRLWDACPNPFNPRTTITFSLDRKGRADIRVYDLTGRLMMVLASRTYPAGDHSVVWNGQDANRRELPSGSYVVRLETVSAVESKKVSLIR